MNSETKRTQDVKVTDKVLALCKVSRDVSEKDTESLSYIVEKSSRIASVTFLLANVLDDASELKTELQRSAIRLVKDAVESGRSEKGREALGSALLTLDLLLDTASRSQQLSRMNTEILSQEIVALSELIRVIDWQSGRRFLDSGLFGSDVPESILAQEPTLTRTNVYQRHERDIVKQRQSYVTPTQDLYSHITTKDIEPKVAPHYKERVQEVQKDRRAIILGLIQKKDRINVRDVTNVIKDCSEKTIQRELLALVKQGVLKKEGERRWSTYSLV